MHKVSKYSVLLLGAVKLICTVCWFVMGGIDAFPGGGQLITAFISRSMTVYMLFLSGVGVGGMLLFVLLWFVPMVLLLAALIVLMLCRNGRIRIASSIYMMLLSFFDFIFSALVALFFMGIYPLTFTLSLVFDIICLVFVFILFNQESKCFFRRNNKKEIL